MVWRNSRKSPRNYHESPQKNSETHEYNTKVHRKTPKSTKIIPKPADKLRNPLKSPKTRGILQKSVELKPPPVPYKKIVTFRQFFFIYPSSETN